MKTISTSPALLNVTSSFRSRGSQFHLRLRSSFDHRICAVKVPELEERKLVQDDK